MKFFFFDLKEEKLKDSVKDEEGKIFLRLRAD